MALNINDAAPAEGCAAVTPSDSTTFSPAPRALYVGTQGNVSIVDQRGVTTLFTAVPGGTILPVRAARVMNTNTTASNIVALF